MTESEIIKRFNKTHDVYATIDRNPTGINQVIMVKENVYRIKKLANEVTEEILEEMFSEFKKEFKKHEVVFKSSLQGLSY